MYSVEKKDYVVKIIFSDAISQNEMLKWLDESKKLMERLSGKFGVFVDMRKLKPLDTDTQKVLEEGQIAYKQKGMERSVVIVESSIVKMQFTRLAKQSGIYQWERYIDASQHTDWEQKGIDWLVGAKDPD